MRSLAGHRQKPDQSWSTWSRRLVRNRSGILATLLDQVVSSGASFLVTIIVARALGPSGFGLFALAWAAWLATQGLSRSLIVHPLTIRIPHLTDHRSSVATASGAARVLGFLAVLLGVLLLVVGTASRGLLPARVAHLIASMGVILPGLLLQDLVRGLSYAWLRPRTALFVSCASGGSSLFLLIVLSSSEASEAWMFLLGWGSGFFVGALVGCWRLRLRFDARVKLEAIRPLVRVGGWFAAENVLYSVAAQVVLYVIAAAFDAATVGGIRSMQAVLAPVTLVAIAGDQFLLPRLAKQDRGRSSPTGIFIYGGSLSVLVIAWGAFVVLLGDGIISTVFGSAFVEYRDLLIPLATAAATGMVASVWMTRIRSLGAGRQLLRAQVLGSLAKLTAVGIMVVAVGTPSGAAWALAAGATAHAAAVVSAGLRIDSRQPA